MKKLISLVLVCVFVLGLVGAGFTDEKSFAEGAVAALEQAEEKDDEEEIINAIVDASEQARAGGEEGKEEEKTEKPKLAGTSSSLGKTGASALVGEVNAKMKRMERRAKELSEAGKKAQEKVQEILKGKKQGKRERRPKILPAYNENRSGRE